MKTKFVLASIGIGLSVSLVLAGCGKKSNDNASSNDNSTSTKLASTTSSTTTTVPLVIEPLTGRAATNVALLARPALTVKIDGAPAAQPQSGLNVADVVFEEMVEGGAVRYLAIFHSQDSDPVGPIRSIRPVDPDIVGPSGGLFAYSGGISDFVEKLRSRSYVADVGASTNGGDYSRRKIHDAPHNLYSSTALLYDGAPEMAPAKPLFHYLDVTSPSTAFGGTTAVAAGRVDTTISGLSNESWAYDAATTSWKRSFNGRPHVVEAGDQIAPTNVVVMLVPYKNTGSVDPVGTPVPEADVLGTGIAYVAAAGKAVTLTWSKATAETPVTFTDSTGAEVKLLPGNTWATLAPQTGVVAFSA